MVLPAADHKQRTNMAAAAEVASAAPALQRCAHQVGGHMTKGARSRFVLAGESVRAPSPAVAPPVALDTADQKPDTLVDANGHFYKPYQVHRTLN